jgi:cytochrome c
MDGFELNKIMGAILGTLLFTLSLSIVTNGIFASHPPAKAGYEIAAKDDKAPAAQAQAEPQVPFENLLAEANPDKGASVARQCAACHDFTKDGPNKVGPGLYGIVNKDVATHAGFNYSNAMKAKKGKWTFEALDKYLENPSKVVPGTSMTFLGIRRATDRAAVISYLNKQSDSPAPLPKPQAAAPAGEKKDDHKAAPAGEKKAEQKGEQKAAPAGEKKDAPVDPAQPQKANPSGTGQTK